MQKTKRPATGIIGYINRRRRSKTLSPRKSRTQRRVGIIVIDTSDVEQGNRCRRMLGCIFPPGNEGALAGKEFLRGGRAKCLGFFTMGDATKS